MIGFFTVITRSYLSYAHVLMSRLAELHPESNRYIFVIDINSGSDLEPSEEAQYVGAKEFFSRGLDQFLHFKYDAFELSNAARPHAHRFLRDQTDCDRWIYLDSDIYPVAPLDSLFEADEEAQILLSPHRTTTSDGILKPYGELRLLQNGPFNSGFLGIKRGPESDRFIEWFENCCDLRCYNRLDYCFVDQLWLGLVPTLFDSVHLCKHPGANIGYWNIDERPLEYNSEGTPTIQGLPVMFLHFSGWDPDHPEIMSCYFSDESVPKPWFDAARNYSRLLKKAQERFPKDIPYLWNTYSDDIPILLDERRKFARMRENNEWPQGLNPFSADNLLREQRPNRSKRIYERICRIPQKLLNLLR